MEPRTLLFNLGKALKYSKKGDFEETHQLEVDPPSFDTFRQSTKLAQAFTRALLSQKDAAKEIDASAIDQRKASDKDIDAAEVKLIMFGADIDFGIIVDSFIDLCQKACTLDQERKVKMRKEHFSRLSYDDTINFTCSYIATFIVPSVLSGLDAEGK